MSPPATDVTQALVRAHLRPVVFAIFAELRGVEELIAERGLSVAHTSVWRWTQTYSPEVLRRLRNQVNRKSSTWHTDETFVRVAGR